MGAEEAAKDWFIADRQLRLGSPLCIFVWAAALSAYLPAFWFGFLSFGLPAYAIAFIPVVLSGLLLGFRGGLAGGALTFGASAVLHSLASGSGLLYSPGALDLVGSALFIALGGLVGRHKDLELRLRREVSRREAAETVAVRQAADLARSNEEFARFADVASHDLREPLRTITSYVQLLQRRLRGKLDAEAEEFLDFTQDGARRMTALIDRLLEYSRAGNRQLAIARFPVSRAFETANANLRTAIDEAQAQVTCDNLPEIEVDEIQFTQLLQNLIANGIKFRGDRPPAIRVEVAPWTEGWKFTVRDNGIGIPPDQAERIFEPFTRLHSQARFQGSGIGLATCRRIVERHGGRIWVESEPGEGASFNFTVPGKK